MKRPAGAAVVQLFNILFIASAGIAFSTGSWSEFGLVKNIMHSKED